MRHCQNETSSLSYKEILEQKDKKNIDPMPPPMPLIRSKFDFIQELKKNLMETSINSHQNHQLQDELNKIILMNNNDNFSTHNNNENYFHQFNISCHDNNTIISEEDFSITNTNNLTNNNIQRLKKNLIDSNNNMEKEFNNIIKFNKLPPPKNKKEIKVFVDNLIYYLNYLLSSSVIIKGNNKLSDEFLIMKYKIEIRYNDYRNHGLLENYFINILNHNQEELINKIMTEIIKSNKKEEIMNVNNNFYSYIGKKRKKSLSEMKSITDGSSSYENNNNDI